MSTHPCLPLWVDDFEAATAHLTPEEDGVYNRLLRLAWRTPGCSLPFDHAWIARKVRMSIDHFERVGVAVLTEFFRVQRGRYVQKRLKDEYDQISRKKSVRQMAGKKGGEAKAAKNNDNISSNATDLPADTRAFQTQIHTQNHNGEAEASPLSAGTPAKAKSRRKPEVSIPDGFPDAAALDDGRTRALKDRRDLDVALEAERFRNHAEQTDRRARDWPAAFRNWIIGAMSRAPRLLAVGASAASALARPFPNAAVREAVVSAKDEPWAMSWLDCCEWDEAEKAVLCPRQLVVDTLRREVPVLERRGAKIKLRPPADAAAPTLFPEDAGRSAA